MKNLIVISIFLILGSVCFGDVGQRIDAQRSRLVDIERVVATKEEAVERLYMRRVYAVRQLAKQQILRLKIEDVSLWVKFISMYDENCGRGYGSIRHYKLMLVDNGEHRLRHRMFNKVALVDEDERAVRLAMLDRYFVERFIDFVLDEGALAFLMEVEADARESLLLRRQVRGVIKVMRDFQQRQGFIEADRERALDKLSRWGDGKREGITRVIGQIEGDGEQIGVVSVIDFGKKSAVMIEGIDRPIVYEGQKVNGIKVVKISSDRVVFRKGLNKWEQKIGQGNAAWIEN